MLQRLERRKSLIHNEILSKTSTETWCKRVTKSWCAHIWKTTWCNVNWDMGSSGDPKVWWWKTKSWVFLTWGSKSRIRFFAKSANCGIRAACFWANLSYSQNWICHPSDSDDSSRPLGICLERVCRWRRSLTCATKLLCIFFYLLLRPQWDLGDVYTTFDFEVYWSRSVLHL